MSSTPSVGRRLAAEWRLVRRDRTLWAALVVLVACLLSASVSAVTWVRAQDAQVAEAAGARPGQWAALPPAALAALSIGRSDVHPTALRLSPGNPETRFAARLENPRARALGRFDIAFVIIVLAPLMMVAVTSDVVTGDRDAGRLALAITAGGSVGALLATRLLLRAGLLTMCAMAVPILTVLSQGDVTTRDAWLLALWMLVVGVYLAFWAAVNAMANAWAARAATGLMALVTVWTALVVAAPALLGLVADAVHATPSRPALVVAMWGAVSQDEAPPIYGGIRPEDDRLRALVASFEDEVKRQEDMATRWRFVSPALVARDAFDAIAGTGLARHRAFAAQVERHLTGSQHAGAPAFKFSEPPVAATVGRVLVDLAALLAAGAVVVVATGFLARRRTMIR